MSKGFIEKWLPVLISALVLSVFAVIGSTLVGLSYESTAERIAQNERDALLRQMAAILPPERYDNDLLTDTIEVRAAAELGADSTTIYRARRNDEDVAAVLSPVTTSGYSGDIVLIVGIYADGTVAGVRVITHKETPGLGDKIEEKRHAWILGFAGKAIGKPPLDGWAVQRDGGQFAQFTGATITPRAVVAAVRRTLRYFRTHREHIFARAAVPTPPAPAGPEADPHG